MGEFQFAVVIRRENFTISQISHFHLMPNFVQHKTRFVNEKILKILEGITSNCENYVSELKFYHVVLLTQRLSQRVIINNSEAVLNNKSVLHLFLWGYKVFYWTKQMCKIDYRIYFKLQLQLCYGHKFQNINLSSKKKSWVFNFFTICGPKIQNM